MSGNVCIACGGTGQRWSGVAYMGTREVVGCDECWGTGFDDVAAGVDGLRVQLAALRELAGEMLADHRARCGDCEMERPESTEGCADFEDWTARLGALSDDQEGRDATK